MQIAAVLIVDAHHHLWDLERLRYPWLREARGEAFYGSYDAIRHSYLLADYLAEAKAFRLHKSVHVEANHDPRDPVAETRWLQAVADDPDSGGFPHAIVAYADLGRDDAADVLSAHCEHANVRGVRQILNYHHDLRLTYTERDLLADPRWRRNVALLKGFGLSFDLQIYYQQMAAARELAAEHAETLFVLNHAGMPVERDETGIDGWKRGMRHLAECPNVLVKISGLGMCDPKWTTDSLRPFVLDTIETFGVERCMFASNFPVDRVFSGFDALYAAYAGITADFTEQERSRLFCGNAERYYRI